MRVSRYGRSETVLVAVIESWRPRSGEDRIARADLYSVGQPLVAFGGVGGAAEGAVLDGYYAEHRSWPGSSRT